MGFSAGAFPKAAMVFAWRKQFGASAIETSRTPAFAPVELIAPQGGVSGPPQRPVAPSSSPSIVASPAEGLAQGATTSSTIEVEIGGTATAAIARDRAARDQRRPELRIPLGAGSGDAASAR